MADYPDDYSSPLPIQPTQPSTPLGSGNFVNPPMVPQGPSMADQRMEQLTKTSQSPLYRIGTALSGRDPVANQMLQQQHMIEQQRQFMMTKQLAVGGMLLQYVEKISSIQQPELRNAVAQAGKDFLGPLLKEIGFNANPSLFAGLIQNPGSSTMLSDLLTSRFGNDPEKINAMVSHISQLKPEQQIPMIKQLYDAEVESATPKWLEHIGGLASKVRSNPSVMHQLGAIDSTGKTMPIPIGGEFEQVVMSAAKTPADKAAIQQIFSDPKHSGFLANRGLMTGTTAEGAQKVIAETLAKEGTPGGQLDIAGKKADLALKGEELKAAPSKLALTQAQTQAALTPSQIPLAGVNTGVAIMPKGANARPEIIIPPSKAPTELTPTEKTTQTEELASAQKLITLRELYKPAYVGVVSGRVSGMTEPLGALTKNESKFRQAIEELRNETLHRLSGAAVSPTEDARIRRQLPDINTAPSVFEARMDQTAANLKFLMGIRRDVLKGAGTNIENLPPIPEDLGKPPKMPSAKPAPSR